MMTFKIKCIKYYIVILLFLVMTVGMSGCYIDLSQIGEDSTMDKITNTLINAIQENDSDTIKQLFSNGVRETVGDEKLDKGVEYLHVLLNGEIVSSERFSQSAGTTIRGGEKQRRIKYTYKVTTTSGTYQLGLIYYITDNITPDYKGLYQLWIKRDSENEYVYIQDDFMGIYMPRVIDESDQNIPHTYNNVFGTFTVPAGYYKDESVSNVNTYYFTIEEIALSDAFSNFFSISFARSEYVANEIDSFREYAKNELNNRILTDREPDGRVYYDAVIEEGPDGKTAQGYPLLTFSIKNDGDTLIDKFYYIVGDKKYVVVNYAYTNRSVSFEQSQDSNSMIEAAKSLVDSFVWAK